MSDLFTITLDHLIAAGWILGWSVAMLVPNKNDYYSYLDRALSWILGVGVGIVAGVLIA